MEQYEIMADLARTIKGKMIISINDHLTIRDVFNGLSNKPLTINYTVDGNHKKKQASELLIWNW